MRERRSRSGKSAEGDNILHFIDLRKYDFDSTFKEKGGFCDSNLDANLFMSCRQKNEGAIVLEDRFRKMITKSRGYYFEVYDIEGR